MALKAPTETCWAPPPATQVSSQELGATSGKQEVQNSSLIWSNTEWETRSENCQLCPDPSRSLLGTVLIPNYPCYANFLTNRLVPSYAWGEAVATSASRFAVSETSHLFGLIPNSLLRAD